MNHIAIGLLAFAAIFGGAVIGNFAARALPEHHLSNESRNAITVSAAIVGTLSALVIGLMISTANASFSMRSNEVSKIAVDIVRIDRLLQRYGPEAQDARAQLQGYARAKIQELFPPDGQPPRSADATVRLLESTQDSIIALDARDPRQRWLRSQALTLSDDVLEARWQLAEQRASNIPKPFLVLLVFWLSLVFASFGLFAPRNATTVAAFCLCSIAVAGGITMILELDSPYSGLVHISGEPMRQALAELTR